MTLKLYSQGLSRDQGLTLIELLIAMVIVGIFAGLSMVSLGRNLRNENLKALTRETVTWFEDIKKLAIQNDAPCEITIDNDQETLSIQAAPSESGLLQCAGLGTRILSSNEIVSNTSELQQCSTVLDRTADPPVVATSELNSLVDFSCDSGMSQTIFSPRGTLTNSVLLTYRLMQDVDQRCIALIAPSGMIRSGKVRGGRCDFKTAY